MSYYDEAIMLTYRLGRWARSSVGPSVRQSARPGERRGRPTREERSVAEASLPTLFRGPVP
ncbi:MAG: hypothetical protein AAF565_13890 [Pseudomonadota bacterium]